MSEPQTWSLFGGICDPAEMPRATALRELAEETGYTGQVRLIPLHAEQYPGLGYTSLVGVTPREYSPTLNEEGDAFMWCDFARWPEPLHPGMRSILADPAAHAILNELYNDRR